MPAANQGDERVASQRESRASEQAAGGGDRGERGAQRRQQQREPCVERRHRLAGPHRDRIEVADPPGGGLETQRQDPRTGSLRSGRKRQQDARVPRPELAAQRARAEQRPAVELDRERLPVALEGGRPGALVGGARQLDPVPADEAGAAAPQAPVVDERDLAPARVARRRQRGRRRSVEPGARDERAAVGLEARDARSARARRRCQRGERGQQPAAREDAHGGEA